MAGYFLRHDLKSWPDPQIAQGEVEFEVGFLGDLMGLGNKDLKLDSSLVDFFKGVETLVFNLEGMTSRKNKWVLKSQTTNHFRHLDEIRNKFPQTRIISGVANNHLDDVSDDELIECFTQIKQRNIEVIGTKEHFQTELRPNLNLHALTFWKGKKESSVATLEEIESLSGQNILFFHQGDEFQLEPKGEEVQRIKELPASFIAVINHHTHFPQRIEIKERFIAWSLGNLAVKYGGHPVNWGIAMKLGFGKKNGEWRIHSSHYTFIKNYPGKTDVLVKVEKVPSSQSLKE